MGHRVVESVRNNKRVMYKERNLPKKFGMTCLFAPQKIGNSTAIGLNELFAFTAISLEEFKRHRDQSYIRNNRETSYYTFMIYLNQDFEGGDNF